MDALSIMIVSFYYDSYTSPGTLLVSPARGTYCLVPYSPHLCIDPIIFWSGKTGIGREVIVQATAMLSSIISLYCLPSPPC